MKRKRGSSKGIFAAAVIRGVVGPGLNSSLGIFFPAVAASLGVGIGMLSLTVSAASIAGMLFMTGAALLFEKYGARKIAFLGLLLVCVPFASLAFGGRAWWWFLCAIPFGMGTVILVNLLGPLIAGGMSRRVGGTLGYMMALSGVAAAVLEPVLIHLLGGLGWRQAYLIGGVTAAVILFLCILVVPKKDYHTVREHHVSDDVSFGLRGGLFLFLMTIAAFNAFHQHMMTAGLSMGLTTAEVGHALFLSMIGAAIGGIFLGTVSARISPLTGGVTALLFGIASVLFFLGAQNTPLFYTATTLHGVASAAIGITAQAIARERCGRDYPHVLASVMRAVPLATVVATPLYGVVFDRTGSYHVALWCILGMLLGSGAVLLISLGKAKKKAKI